MTKERQIRLNEMLEEHKQRLQRTLSARIDEMRAPHHDGKLPEGLDPADASAADLEQTCGVALLELASQSLVRVDQALARLEDGEYGVCSDCDTPIAAKRLEALPFAVRCRECEELHESREHARRVSRRAAGSLVPRLVEWQ